MRRRLTGWLIALLVMAPPAGHALPVSTEMGYTDLLLAQFCQTPQSPDRDLLLLLNETGVDVVLVQDVEVWRQRWLSRQTTPLNTPIVLSCGLLETAHREPVHLSPGGFGKDGVWTSRDPMKQLERTEDLARRAQPFFLADQAAQAAGWWTHLLVLVPGTAGVREALEKGRTTVANETLSPAAGTFVQVGLPSGLTLTLGGTYPFEDNARLAFLLPRNARCALHRDGMPVMDWYNQSAGAAPLAAEGHHRLVCHLGARKKEEPWLYTSGVFLSTFFPAEP